MIFESESYYIASASDLKDKIIKIQAIIAALEVRALDTIDNIDVEEYRLEDGQMTIKTSFRSPDAIWKAINQYDIILQRYINQLNGRVVRLLDAKTATNTN